MLVVVPQTCCVFIAVWYILCVTVVWCLLFVACCVLLVACCLLFGACCLVLAAASHFALVGFVFVVWCLLFGDCCLMCVVCWRLLVVPVVVCWLCW